MSSADRGLDQSRQSSSSWVSDCSNEGPDSERDLHVLIRCKESRGDKQVVWNTHKADCSRGAVFRQEWLDLDVVREIYKSRSKLNRVTFRQGQRTRPLSSECLKRSMKTVMGRFKSKTYLNFRAEFETYYLRKLSKLREVVEECDVAILQCQHWQRDLGQFRSDAAKAEKLNLFGLMEGAYINVTV